MLYDFIFFFKQKTAYEMRISDWSSDVCSSDLTLVEHRIMRVGHPFHRSHQAGRRREMCIAVLVQDTYDRPATRGGSVEQLQQVLAERGHIVLAPVRREIGSGSWRESVCQYV